MKKPAILIMNLTILIGLTLIPDIQAKDYVIYSVYQDVPMGKKDEVIRKNYYIDIGKNQGVKKGNTIDVFRVISVLDPYENKKRFNHKVKIGELKIVHAEESSAIGIVNKIEDEKETPVFEIGQFMIGDIVTVKIN